MADFDAGSILLTDRVAIVTGAARGIGRATAALFARVGARVAVCDRLGPELADSVKALEAGGAEVVSVELDVRDAAAVDAFVGAAADRFGRVDVLVNNAGGTFVSPFLDVSPKGEAMLVAENFGQASHFIRATVPFMPAGGSIVNITSIEAHQAAPGFAVYAAMKAALESLTRSLALELGPRGIRVNCIAPDALPSEGERGARDEMLALALDFEPTMMPPLGRFGTPEDGAGSALFLASDLSRFVTGTTLHLDGGNRAAGGWRLVEGRGTPE
jgi:3-oxoacyl-[acyl-carrier protein] reductase